ncbi:DUF421 domain-containing protein [Aquihabitans sp. McL0605]|uniref:DUF421 domain-containing protein n=1 Tax=Aquihabitans sp. McL0605 TaxID=3415671 RepID=UPI003CE87899
MMLLASQLSTHLFSIDTSILEKVLRTVAVYLGLLFVLRLVGKRDLAQLNSFDLVVLLLLSNVVQNAIIGPDDSLIGGLLGVVVLLGVNFCVVHLARRSDAFARVVEGTASTLVTDGTPDEAELAKLGLRTEELAAAVRRQGASSMAEVQEATLAPDGTITVTLRPDDENATKGDIKRLEAMVAELLGGRGPAAGPA